MPIELHTNRNSEARRSPSSHWRSICAFVTLMAAMGCGNSSDHHAAVSGVWSLDGFGNLQPAEMLEPDSRSELSIWFKQDGTFVTGAYNGFFGEYRAVDGSFSASATVARAIGNLSLEPQTSEFTERIANATHYDISMGVLTLSSGRGELVLSNRLPDLSRTSWLLDRIRDSRDPGPGISRSMDDVRRALIFQPDSTLDVQAGCVTAKALPYRLDNRSPVVGGVENESGPKWDGEFRIDKSIESTPGTESCSAADASFDVEFIDLLERSRTYAVVHGELVLRSASSGSRRDLVFKRTADR